MKDAYNIDELLRAKPWQDLIPEERRFVLEQVESQAEYDSLRETVLTIDGARAQEEVLVPDPAIKESLLKQFEVDGRTKVIWLNSVATWLIPSEKKVYQMPIAQIAATVAIVLGATFTFNAVMENSAADEYAQYTPETEQTSEEAATAEEDEGAVAETDDNKTDDVTTTETGDLTDSETTIEPAPVVFEPTEEVEESLNFASNIDDVEMEAEPGGGAVWGFVSSNSMQDTMSAMGDYTYEWQDNMTDIAVASWTSSDNFATDATAIDGIEEYATVTRTVDESADKADANDSDNTVVYHDSSGIFTTADVSSSTSTIDLPVQGVSLKDNDELIELLFSTL